LLKGFESLGWLVEVQSLPSHPHVKNTTAYLIQIHGSPQSSDEDRELICLLENMQHVKLAILIHRPDELQVLHPNFHSLLVSLASSRSVPLRLVFLGDKNLHDAFYNVGAHITVCQMNLKQSVSACRSHYWK
jgi:hypothetical protein